MPPLHKGSLRNLYTVRKLLLVLILILPLLWVNPRISQAQDGDFMLWAELKYHHRVGDGPWKIKWSTESRFDMDVTRYMLFNTVIGFDYKFFEWFKAGMNFKFEKERTKPGEYRPFPEATLSGKLGPIKFESRNRFEARFFNDGDKRFRYRNRIKAGPKFKTRLVSFSPYAADEIFLETNKSPGGFNQNRFLVGNVFGFLKDRVKFDLYYLLRQDKKSSGWIMRHILGTALTLDY